MHNEHSHTHSQETFQESLAKLTWGYKFQQGLLWAIGFGLILGCILLAQNPQLTMRLLGGNSQINSEAGESFLARVDQVIGDGSSETIQLILTAESGSLSGQQVSSELGLGQQVQYTNNDKLDIQPGELFVVNGLILEDSEGNETPQFLIRDKYRLGGIFSVVAIFLCLTIALAGVLGVRALLGLGLSVLIIVGFVVPNILQGQDALVFGAIGAALIASTTIYLAHGFSTRTSLAVAATLLSLVVTLVLALLFVYLSNLYGVGTEEALILRFDNNVVLNLRGLLLAGIMISVLGVLDDVTTAQVAAVAELHQLDATISSRSLWQRGLRIGREHVLALVNTLVLAYAGSGFALFILFTTSSATPLWVNLNDEIIAEEIIKSLVGSGALMLSVPIATGLAVFYYKYLKGKSWKLI